ncbi:MAG: hypothetical protein IMW89_22975 [Ktedonobacteraceae bacterium]|nr:hypothetical protein [Ktedonobacteraceae bacterium]
MNVPDREELRALMQVQETPCLSLFFPTYRGGADMQQNRMQLVNQVRRVEQRLLHGELVSGEQKERAETTAALLKPLNALLADETFWEHPGDGMVLLRSPSKFYSYHLPFPVKEYVRIATHFYLKPLLPLLNDGSFYILALSQNELRLFEGTRYDIQAVDVPEKVPESLAEALKYDEPENEVRYYSSSSGTFAGKGGRRAVIFYGQGVGIDDTKENLLRYFQQIDRGLHELFHDQQAPLLLAGVEYLLPIYREANTYPHLVDEGLTGNPEKMSAEALHQRAWPLVEPYVLRGRQEALARYRDLEQTEWASANISEIVPAACYGRIADLFVALDDEVWGVFDAATHTIEIHQQAEAHDDDLLDLAAVQTWLHRGSVYAVERAQIPGAAPAAAVFRY